MNPGRRRARRTQLFSEVLWHNESESTARRGILVGVSDTGLALVTDHRIVPRPGARIVPEKKRAHRRWGEPVVVTRIDRLSDELDLVAAKYA